MQGQTKVFNYPNATVRVHIPDLAPKQIEENTKALIHATENLLREMIKNEYAIRNDSTSK